MDAVVDTIIHPLDPLSLSEIAEAVAILKDEKALAETIRFPIIRLEEPTKADLAAFRAGKPLPRNGRMATILKFVGTASSRKNAL